MLIGFIKKIFKKKEKIAFNSSHIKLIQGDITKKAKDFDVIVNAANNSLLGGGGVDGAIHRAAGPDLLEECKTLGGCATGQAKATEAYNIPCKKIIHTVGPVYNAKYKLESQKKLASAYRESMNLAKELGMKTVLFPSISTGIYGYPVESAAKTALYEAFNFLIHNPEMEFTWVLFTEEDFNTYKKVLERLLK